jgi:hypothetical protein
VLGVASGLFVWLVAGFALTWWRSTRRSAVLVPLAYFLLQTASACLAVYSTWLYAIGLAMHYVEYHVLMIPRCFHVPLDARFPTDRWLGRLRRHKLLFYGLLAVLSVPVTRYAWLGMSRLYRLDEASSGVTSRMLISVFDGLFIFHYVIESRIWRFGEPYYRESLIPLYFRARQAAGAAACRSDSSDEAPQIAVGPVVVSV